MVTYSNYYVRTYVRTYRETIHYITLPQFDTKYRIGKKQECSLEKKRQSLWNDVVKAKVVLCKQTGVGFCVEETNKT